MMLTLKKLHQKGFTIVELLIVVVVIAILAAITIVSFNNITSRAKESSLKADLSNSAKSLEIKRTLDGDYPANGAGAALQASTGNTLSYVKTQAGYCVAGVNGSLNFKVTHSGSVESGICDRAWVSKGGAGPSCGAGCYYVTLNTSSFTPGSYQVRCVINGAPTSYVVRSLNASGPHQLTCYTGISGATVAVEIQNWGLSETLVW